MLLERESGFKGSLFERIREESDSPARRKPKEALLHSVQANLQNVLNTRSGSCYGSPELGIADFNDDSLASGNYKEEMEKALSRCISRYEPRFSTVKVSAVEMDAYAPMELRFHIAANIDAINSQDVLEFDILLDNHQHWHME
jgi:type VI secretion system protein